MSKNSPVSKAIRAFKNPMVRVLILIIILFAATYGGVEVMRLALHTDSPLMVVSSGSMVPVLNVGDIIIVRGADPQAITVGTIIIFHSPYEYDMPIVHRVVAVVNDGGSLFFQTKGDHNEIQDGWKVPAENLIGVYVVKIPYIGLISLELRGPLGVTLIILLVALIIAVEYNESKSATGKHR
ncbi:MAG: signal peptidase I [Candidatus Bathyarchaeia archaeon]